MHATQNNESAHTLYELMENTVNRLPVGILKILQETAKYVH